MQLRGILLFVTLSLTISSNIYALNKLEAVQIYSDMLLEQFDRELDQKIIFNDGESILKSEVYMRLLSARKLMEAHTDGEEAFVSKMYLPELNDTKFFAEIVSEIDQSAKSLTEKMDSENPKELVIYPSNQASGNIHGGRFPRGHWALTFDDGPKNGTTQKIVDELYANGINATFFMVMEKVMEFPRTAQYVLDAGFELALHSYTHQNLSKANPEELQAEITMAKTDIEEALNRQIKFFRLPYGAGLRKTEVRDVITQNNLVHVFWNVDSLDWKDKDPASILARVRKQMALKRNQGGVILFHDIHSQTVRTIAPLIEYFHELGVQTCHLSDFMAHLNGKEQGCIK